MTKTTRTVKSVLASALVLASLSAGIFATSTTPAFADGLNVPAQVMSDTGKATLAPMIKRVLPSVVSIDVKAVETVQQDDSPQDLLGQLLPKEFQDLLGQGFGQGTHREVKRNVRYAGSGVILDAKNGYVVTNNHVVAGGKVIQVKLYDNRVYNAKIVGTDPDTDLAVLKLENFSNLQQINLGNSSQSEVGDFVVALGNPFGIGLTATSGIISALNRSADLNVYSNFIQTDASINKGNSGGALVDLQGNLIGINSAILSGTGGSVGIGFAIPVNIVKSITSQIIEHGKVSRGQIGIRGNNLNSQLQQTLKLGVTEGAFVSEVLPGSSAEKAGLKAGDVIIKLNNTKIVDFNQLRALVGSIPANTTFEITYIRNGQAYTTKITSQPRPQANHTSITGDKVSVLGATFANDNSDLVVSKVNPNSQFAMYGIKAGDKLISIQGKNVATTADVNKVIEDNSNSDVLIFKFARAGKTIFVTISNPH